MKRKILALGLFGLCGLAFFAAEAKAFFGLCSPWHRHNRYVTQITCRPYNAFTPICWGNLVCDGCCPNPCGVASGQMPMNMGAPPWACPCPGFDCGPPPFAGFPGCDGCLASDMPMMAPPPMHGPPMRGPMYGPPMPGPYGPPMPGPMPPDNRQPPFIGPPPMPLPPNPGMTMYPYTGVAQANYYPMYPQPQPYPNYYMPTYNPYMGWPAAQPAPYYWYGGR